jgi:hypothetical protein
MPRIVLAARLTCSNKLEVCVQDAIFILISIAFFALGLGYIEFCNRVR